MGTLDAAAANGPEGDVAEWDAVDWARTEDEVRRLRQRIFTASKAGDLKKVRSLQRLMLRSCANALVSVRRVTEVNAGRKTAGVDGRDVLASREKADLAAWLQHGAAAWKPRPVRRVYIPKANGKRRGLGIRACPVAGPRGHRVRRPHAAPAKFHHMSTSSSKGTPPKSSTRASSTAARSISTSAEEIGDVRYRVAGDLTIKGVTRPVTVDFDYTGSAVDPYGNQRIGFEGTTSVNRKDWGVNWNAALEAGGVLVSENVTLEFEVSAIRSADAD